MKVNVTYLLNLNIITKRLFMGIAIVWLVLGGGLVWDVCADIPPDERKALIALYNSTDGDNWSNNSGWKEPPLDTDGFAMPGTESNWHGITLDAAGTTVERIELYNNNLKGPISPELGNLTNLVSLQLSRNKLTGNIPSEIGNLSNLQGLHLYCNELTGSIPSEIGDLSHLLYLDLGDNQLTGSIPPEIGNLTNLIGLYLGANQWTGSIPSEIGNLTNLVYLFLPGNQLTGSIPPEIGTLSDLQELYLAGNQLTGTIPSEIGNLTNLQYLYLGHNGLTGSIPTEIGTLANLVRLRLSGNQLTGSIPSEIGNLTCLVRLYLNSNNLTGTIPTGLTDLINLSDTATDIGYNALYTDDDTLRVFLNSKDPDWEDTQTIAPQNVGAASASSSSIQVSWTPITYTAGPGGYRVFHSTTSNGPYTLFGATADKSVSQMEITGLDSSTTYYCIVQTRTEPNGSNWNTVDSEYSEEVSATTAQNPGGADEGRRRGGGGCFIATAAFGSATEGHVGILTDFRDQYLHSCQFGRKFISAYYKYSPPVAHFISKHDTLKTVVRIALLPLIAVSYAMLHFGPTLTLTIILFLLIPPIFLSRKAPRP